MHEKITVSTARFDEMGIPQNLIDYVSSRTYPKQYRKLLWGTYALVVVVMVGMFALLFWGNFALLGALEQVRTAGLDPPYQYFQDIGAGSIVLIFVIILSLGVVTSVIVRGLKKDLREYVVLASLEMAANTAGLNGRLTRAWYKASYKDLAGLRVDQQLLKIHQLNIAMYSKPFIMGLLLAAPLILLDVNNYDVANEKGATFGPYFSPNRTTHPWEDATGVECGCWVSDKGEMKLYYEVHWANGESYNLLDGKADEMAITLADSVNRRLTERGVARRYATFTFGIHSGELKNDPECAPRLRQIYSPETFGTLQRLIHPDHT